MTGAKLVAADLGLKLDSVHLQDLGSADRVVVTKDETTIFGGHGPEAAVQAHVDTLRAAIERTHDPHYREKLQERLANLAGKSQLSASGALPKLTLKKGDTAR